MYIVYIAQCFKTKKKNRQQINEPYYRLNKLIVIAMTFIIKSSKFDGYNVYHRLDMSILYMQFNIYILYAYNYVQ